MLVVLVSNSQSFAIASIVTFFEFSRFGEVIQIVLLIGLDYGKRHVDKLSSSAGLFTFHRRTALRI